MTKKPAKPTKTNRRKARPVEIDFLDVPACTNTAVRRASRRLSNLYDDAFEAVGLKATQVSLLAEVDRITSQNGGVPPTLQDLAQKLAILISALTHALRPLVRDGLIELLQDEQDGRTKRAVLTTAGAASLEEAGRRWSVINQRIEDVLGAESAATLRALSDHVASDEFLAAYHHVKAQNG